MSEPFSFREIASIGLFLLILSIGIGLWISPYRIRRTDKVTGGLLPWKLSWTDFGLWAWGMFVLVFGVQMFVYTMIPEWFPEIQMVGEDGTPTIPGMFFAAVTLQVPMLIFFFGIRMVQPDTFRFQLSPEQLAPMEVVGKSFHLFFLIMPLVWLISLAWTLTLRGLAQVGVPVDLEPQELVQTVAGLSDPLSMLAFFVLAVVLAPLAEEFIFRAGIYRFLKGVLHPNLALLLSGFLFALLHNNLASFVPLWFLGIALAKSYEVTGNIRVPILIHAIFNLNQLLFIFLQPPEAALP